MALAGVAALLILSTQYIALRAFDGPLPEEPLAVVTHPKFSTNIFAVVYRPHYWLCVLSGTNLIPYETNFDWSGPAFYTNVVGGTNRGAYALETDWSAYPANLHNSNGPVTEVYDAAWTYLGRSNYVGGLLTNAFTVVINPFKTNVITVNSVSPTMMVTSNLFSPIWFPVSTNLVKLTNPIGNWFWIGTNVTIQKTSL